MTAPSHTAAAPSRYRLSGPGRVWVLTGLIAVAAVVLYLLGIRGLEGLAAPFHIPWWALAALFAAAETFVIHLQFRRQAESFSLGEIVTVLALFFASPTELVVAQVIGGAVALAVHRRQSLVKLAFNLAHFGLGACVAAAIFHALAPALDPVGPLGWIAAFAAILGADVLGAILVGLAISLAER